MEGFLEEERKGGRWEVPLSGGVALGEYLQTRWGEGEWKRN